MQHRLHRNRLGLLLIALLALTAWQNRRLTQLRRAGLPEAAEYAAQAPPFLNFVTVGLAGFRGVAAEALWWRADELQQEGRYLELVQLSEWITWLDPHATEAWSYNAWNMAYNISALMRRPEDRLRWVEHGVNLLRDHGLPANPHNARLYRELAWLYQHKIGGMDDSAHVTYQLQLAAAMSPTVNADGTLSDTTSNRETLAARRLDADRMLRLQRRFGPLDWRLPMTHALYWASIGLEHARPGERLAARRAVYQPLAALVSAGRFTGDLPARVFRTAPNPALAPAVVAFLKETVAEYPTRGVRTAYALFLAQAIRAAQSQGHSETVRAWYDDYRRASAGIAETLSLEQILNVPDPARPNPGTK